MVYKQRRPIKGGKIAVSAMNKLLNESYKNCVSKIKLDLPVKLTPMI